MSLDSPLPTKIKDTLKSFLSSSEKSSDKDLDYIGNQVRKMNQTGSREVNPNSIESQEDPFEVDNDYQDDSNILDPILDRLTDEATADRAFAQRLDQYLSDSLKKSESIKQVLGSLGNKESSKPSAFILGLTEFHWNKVTKTLPSFKGHKLIVDRSATPKPRAALYASANLDVWQCDSYTNRDMATLCWLVQGAPFKRVYVTSVYMPDHSKESDPHLRRTPVITSTRIIAYKECCIRND